MSNSFFTKEEIKAVKAMGWSEQYCILCCKERKKPIKVTNFICEECRKSLDKNCLDFLEKIINSEG
jgi:hypothetical protein